MSSWSSDARVFEALSNSYRRRLLLALLDSNPQVDDDPDPSDTSVDGDGDPDVRRSELIHTHLPKLDDMGFIEWDRENDEIRTGPDWDEVSPLLQLIHDHRGELPEEWP